MQTIFSGKWRSLHQTLFSDASLLPTDLIVLLDGFDVFVQRDLAGLADVYNDFTSEDRVIFGGERNCWPFPHKNVTLWDFESRTCYKHRNCIVQSAWGKHRLYPFMRRAPVDGKAHFSSKTSDSIMGQDICRAALQKFGGSVRLDKSRLRASLSESAATTTVNMGTMQSESVVSESSATSVSRTMFLETPVGLGVSQTALEKVVQMQTETWQRKTDSDNAKTTITSMSSKVEDLQDSEMSSGSSLRNSSSTTQASSSTRRDPTWHKFPFVNAGTSIGTVFAYQKLLRRFFQLVDLLQEQDDQALMLFLSLEPDLIDVDSDGRFTLNLHGFMREDLQDKRHMCSRRYFDASCAGGKETMVCRDSTDAGEGTICETGPCIFTNFARHESMVFRHDVTY